MIKTIGYGIRKSVNGGYLVLSDVSEDKRYYYEHTTLVYKRAEFALLKAEKFIKACYRNQNVTFVNMGIV